MVVISCLALAGCVEVTPFRDAGGDVYLAQCDGPLRLESCKSALAAVCPNGYDITETVMVREGARQVPTNSGFFRCR